ncbi:ubiquitin protein ligase [Capsaspora owczarzaki ATCC 30864]|uniref:HECT-type E3 ubiquitin transferase n=1 Tax=Capsaspora owczarzaki (strain ATCC 30864) TaxID=595528 RepID=A0A0D2WID9_CAPO3|nr:ubiquitin protein ligase [Capsaspora owczarzaki ATCC 30864]KJE88758.1 ubiquitin protein ligase [Capsaspora owczarzaki ATCC 30864]|eukprot:XP_004365219.1 ubiquitin protein ligase [Capsaspora owczarzaki ATCC 30864]
MNSAFFGGKSSQRTVSMSGRGSASAPGSASGSRGASSNVSSAALIEQQQRERAERSALRQRHEAAARIQKCFKRMRAAAGARRQLRVEFDWALSQLHTVDAGRAALDDTNAPTAMSIDTPVLSSNHGLPGFNASTQPLPSPRQPAAIQSLLPLIRRLAIFHSLRDASDLSRVEHLAAELLVCLESTTFKQDNAPLLSSKAFLQSLFVAMKQFAVIVLKRLTSPKASVSVLSFGFLNMITDPSKWQSFSATPDTARDAHEAHQSLLVKLRENNSLAILINLLLLATDHRIQEPVAASTFALKDPVPIVEVLVRTLPPASSGLPFLLRHLFTIPLLSTRLSATQLAILFRNVTLQSMFSVASVSLSVELVESGALEPASLAAISGNLAEIVNHPKSFGGDASSPAFIQAVYHYTVLQCAIVSYLPHGAFGAAFEAELERSHSASIDSDDEDNDTFEEEQQRRRRLLASGASASTGPRTVPAWQRPSAAATLTSRLSRAPAQAPPVVTAEARRAASADYFVRHPLDARLCAQLLNLGYRSHLRTLFQLATATLPADSQQGFNGSIMRLHAACTLVNLLLRRSAALRRLVLTGMLSLGAAFPAHIWRVLHASGALQTFGQRTSFTDMSHLWMLQAVSTFAELFLQILTTMDDEEFMSGSSSSASVRAGALAREHQPIQPHAPSASSSAIPMAISPANSRRESIDTSSSSSRMPFSPAELAVLSQQLTELTVALYLPEQASPAQGTDDHALRRILTLLTRHLYDRDARVHFVDPQVWRPVDLHISPEGMSVASWYDVQLVDEDSHAADQPPPASSFPATSAPGTFPAMFSTTEYGGLSAMADVRHGPASASSVSPQSPSVTIPLPSFGTSTVTTLAQLASGASQPVAMALRGPATPVTGFSRPFGVAMHYPQIRRQRQLAILRNLPFTVPFDTRIQVFRALVSDDLGRLESGDGRMFGLHLTVRRAQIFEDAFATIFPTRDQLKQRLRVTFISDIGTEEAGIGQGVVKEFLTEVIQQGFAPDTGLFLATSDNSLYPNPSAVDARSQRLFEFLGMMLGKVLYEGILVELPLARFFLGKLLGRQIYINDLASLDPQLYKNLVFVKQFQGDVEELGLAFTETESQGGFTREVDLIPGGSGIAVNNENRIRYIFAKAHYRLNSQMRVQSRAFLRGLSTIVPTDWLQLFDQDELQAFISGGEGLVDIEDLRENTVYQGSYSQTHPTILMFWDVVRSFDHVQRRDLLKFVTSCSRPPLLGFSHLVPKFGISPSGDGDSPDRLPSAATCFNLLRLPAFSSAQTLREKLLYAIEANAGFELS